MKECRACAKNKVERHKVLDSRKMHPEGGLSWILDRVFIITVNADQTDQWWKQDGRPKTAGDSYACSARRVGYRKNEAQNSRRGVGKSDVDVDAAIHDATATTNSSSFQGPLTNYVTLRIGVIDPAAWQIFPTSTNQNFSSADQKLPLLDRFPFFPNPPTPN